VQACTNLEARGGGVKPNRQAVVVQNELGRFKVRWTLIYMVATCSHHPHHLSDGSRTAREQKKSNLKRDPSAQRTGAMAIHYYYHPREERWTKWRTELPPHGAALMIPYHLENNKSLRLRIDRHPRDTSYIQAEANQYCSALHPNLNTPQQQSAISCGGFQAPLRPDLITDHECSNFGKWRR